MNFPAFYCQGNSGNDLKYRHKSGRMQRIGRVLFADDTWQVEFQGLPETAELVKELKVRGGYGITHVGRLTRQDGRPFTIKAAARALRQVHLFLSYSRGSWVPVLLPVGFDKNGNRLYEDWSVSRCTPWEPRSSWFDENHGECLAALFQGLSARLNDADFGQPLEHALYWYLASNRAAAGVGVDGGIILSQAALERLSLACVTSFGLHSGSTAADLVRAACAHLGIPTQIRSNMGLIYSGKRKGQWTDIPHSITKMRNELVHPRSRLKTTHNKLIPEIWQLAQWYIELMILALSGYRGDYSNRLHARWRGQVESVPWL